MKLKYKKILIGVLCVSLIVNILGVCYWFFYATSQKENVVNYDIVTEEENIFRNTYHSFFSDIDSEEFQIFSKNFQSFSFLSIGVLRLEDRENWIKLFQLRYEGDVELKKNILKTPLKNKEGYIQYITQFYDDIVSDKNILPSTEEVSGGNDMLITFSDHPLELALGYCEYSQKDDNDATYCTDSIYFYRATQENNYCSKIENEYREQFCKDFLKYEG